MANLRRSIFYLSAVHFLSNSVNAPHFIDRFNVAPLLNAPVETITQGLLLRYKPLNLDVLPLYVVLMGSFPPVLWLMLRHRNWVILGSILLYFSARQFGWNLSSYPSGVWYFNPFAWQLLFVLGAWLALGGSEYAAFLGALEDRSGLRVDLLAIRDRHDVSRADTGTSAIVPARSVRGI